MGVGPFLGGRTIGGLTAKGSLITEAPPQLAEIVTSEMDDLVRAVKLNTAEELPPGTGTFAGISIALGLLVLSVTIAPDAGAGVLKKIVPVATAILPGPNGSTILRLKAI